VVSSEVSPDTVSDTVTGEPGCTVPDEGETVSDPSRALCSEIDQVTGPPVAVSVRVPPSSGVSTTVAGDTLSVPAATGGVLVAVADGVGVGVGVAVSVGDAVEAAVVAVAEAGATGPRRDRAARVRSAIVDPPVADRLCPAAVVVGAAVRADAAEAVVGARATVAVPREAGGP